MNIKAVKAADECTDRTFSEILLHLCVSHFVRMDNVSLCLLEERPTSSLKPHTYTHFIHWWLQITALKCQLCIFVTSPMVLSDYRGYIIMWSGFFKRLVHIKNMFLNRKTLNNKSTEICPIQTWSWSLSLLCLQPSGCKHNRKAFQVWLRLIDCSCG